MCIYSIDSWIYIIMYNTCVSYCNWSYIIDACTELIWSSWKLRIESRYIIIIFRLEHITGNWIAESIFRRKSFDGEAGTIVTTSIGQAPLVKSELFRLFVQQEYISVETRTLRRSSTNVFRKNFSFTHIRFRNIAY